MARFYDEPQRRASVVAEAMVAKQVAWPLVGLA